MSFLAQLLQSIFFPITMGVADEQSRRGLMLDRQAPAGGLHKAILLGLCGAIGCLVGALVGEALLASTRLPPPPPPPEQLVCLLIDTSGSMSGNRIREVKEAAKAFVHKQDLSKGKIGVVRFDSDARIVCPLEKDHAKIDSAIDGLTTRGSTRMDLGLREAGKQLRAPGQRTILLFTDGMPDNRELARAEAEKARREGLQIVAIGTDDAQSSYLSELTGDSRTVFDTKSGDFGAAFDKAEKIIYPRTKQLVESSTDTAQEYGLGPTLLRIGGWTALLALFASLALIVGQNLYLKRRLLTVGSFFKGGVGSVLAGFVAGAAGQLIFQAAAVVPAGFLEIASRFVGWAMLGGLLGAGMAFFVPNLKLWRALLGGSLGGAVGAICFVAASRVVGDFSARLGGAAGLGFFIGVMVAVAEMAFRSVWLEIAYGPREIRTVSLGTEAVSIGSDGHTCTIYAQNAPAIAFRYRLVKNMILCEDAVAGREGQVSAGDRKVVGSVEVTVRTSGVAAVSAPTTMPASVAPAPAPALRPAAPPAGIALYSLLLGSGATYFLKVGTRLQKTDLPGLHSTGSEDVVAEVVVNPSNVQILGLKNASKSTWSVILPDGNSRQVEFGRSVQLRTGTRIDFGPVKGEIR